MNNFLIFIANPRLNSAVNLLSKEFVKKIKTSSNKIEEINICKAKLPSFSDFIANADNYGQKNCKDEKMPKEILEIIKKWRNSDVITFFVPNWWGTGPAEIVDLFCWLSDEIAKFEPRKKPVGKMQNKKIFWITAGAAPKLIRKLFFKTDPEKWGKYIFSFSGAKFYSKFFDSVHMGQGKISEKMKKEIRKFSKKIL